MLVFQSKHVFVRKFLAMSAKCMLFEVTVPASPTAWEALAVFYGYTPVLYVGLLLVVCVIKKGGTREFSYIVLSLISLMVAFVVKAIVKEERPLGSMCRATLGMPSSHSSMSLAWITLLALDMTACQPKPMRHSVMVVALTMLLLLPVPVARIILHDHSPIQTMVGCLLGVTLGCAWFGLTVPLRTWLAPRLGERLLWVFKHNYPPISPAALGESESLLT